MLDSSWSTLSGIVLVLYLIFILLFAVLLHVGDSGENDIEFEQFSTSSALNALPPFSRTLVFTATNLITMGCFGSRQVRSINPGICERSELC